MRTLMVCTLLGLLSTAYSFSCLAQEQERSYPEPDELAKFIRYEPRQGGAETGGGGVPVMGLSGLEELLALGVKPEDVAKVREKYEAIKKAVFDRRVQLVERSVLLSEDEAVVSVFGLCGLSTLVVFPFELEKASVVVSNKAFNVQRLGNVLAVTPLEEHVVGTVGVVLPEGKVVLLSVREVGGAQQADGVLRVAELRRMSSEEVVELLVRAVLSGQEPEDPRAKREGFSMRSGVGGDVLRAAGLKGLCAFALRGRYLVDGDPNVVLVRREGNVTVVVARGRTVVRRAEDGQRVVLSY
ncbi:MAG: hypothetical protein QW650_01110 [Thermofilum sp.]